MTAQQQMKAMVYTRYGPPEVVRLQEVTLPTVKPDELLIKIHATTVNRTDCGFRSANYFIVRFFSGLFKPRVKILGCEFAGEIEAVGKDVSNFKPGDRVFGYDDTHFGGHGEYKVMAASGALATIPEGMDYTGAAPLTEGSHYALGNIRAAKIKQGDTVMVYGATGAIGSAVLMIRKLAESGDFKPVIDRTYPLEQLVEAYRYVETGQKTGNVVVTLENSDQP